MMKVTLSLVLTMLAAMLVPAAASAAVVEMGATQPRLTPSCPANCQAVGRVSGYQVAQGPRRNPFLVRRRGKIVAFSLQLGIPSAEQITYFNDLFGGAPQARVSVLRPEGSRRYVLSGHSRLFELDRYFGTTPTFALDRPLTVRPKYIVAVTVPTWAPAFGVGLANEEAWRSSRADDRCDDVRQEAAQQRRGSQRTYGCLYRTARLLYTASLVPDPTPAETEPSTDSPTPRPPRAPR